MFARMELSVVVPVHDEAPNIPLLVAELCQALDGLVDAELIVVNDGSEDDTLARLKEARVLHPGLRIVHHQHNAGQSAALWSGAQAARGRWLATLDGDLQNDPADLLRLQAAVLGDPGLDLVVGHRRARNDDWLRRVSSRTANTVRRFLLGDDTPDTGCGLKLVRRSTFLALPYFDHMHRFLPALVLRAAGRVRSVPVGHRPRVAGRSHYGVFDRLWVGIVDLVGVAWLQRRKHRCRAVEEL